MRLLLVAFVFIGHAALSAIGSEATASLSHENTTVGQPVQLEIRISGGRPTAPPQDLHVEGLQINYVGTSQSSQITFGNGGMRAVTEISYTYQVMPERTGNFTIPSFEVDVDGRAVRTQPVTLRVQNERGGGSAGGAAGGANAPMTRVGFAEIVLPKKTAYIGESVPAEVRLYVDTRVRWQPETMPILEGEGFTKTKMPEPRQERARRDGREYDVLVFQTVISPSKAGKVRIGPAEISFHAQIPRAQPNRRRSPFGDVFGNDLFNDPFGTFGAVERRTAKTDVAELDVKPLPAVGRPANFSGAVGNFTLSAEGTPKSVKIGDPLTMTLTVSGRGNFDRMGAPVLVDQNGWRTYPPSNNFKPEDDVSMRGSKTFQIAVIPETKKTEMPRFEFAYFDPEAEKYVTLTTDPAPLTVEGSEPPPPTAPSQPAPARSAAQPPPPDAATPTPMTDILGLRYDVGRKGSFVPLYETRGFWLVQLAPLTALLVLLGTRMRRSSAEAREIAALRRERSTQEARLQRANGRAEFLDAAARAIQLDTALATGQSPGTVDATEACRSRQLDTATITAVQDIFDSRAALLYAGDGHGAESVSPTERERVLATVAQFEKSHGRN